MERKYPEILAPVGGKEQLLAAVRSGADAVYFGMKNFNARRNAENFGSNLPETIEYCHLHGVKVNLTVNTLVTDPELKEMHTAVDEAARSGADALIIQDLAVASYVRKHWPELPMHASTQMAVHNVSGVRELLDYGFQRIVLARELSLEEIRSIYEATHAPLEVFVHGAHCMSVSGNCYMSSMIGGRSGNRGLCAQPCRLDWRIGDRQYALSLKDLSYIRHLKELSDCGVCSLKIEGRMKRPEYVAASVLACRQELYGIQNSPLVVNESMLRSVFSRSGFTDGYLTGSRDSSMFGYRTKDDVLAAGGVLEDLAKTYEKEPQDLPVDMILYAQGGEDSRLTAVHRMHTVTVTGAEPQPAKTLPLTQEYAARSLSKTGGTAFTLQNLQLAVGNGLMLPASALNDLRRRALEELQHAIVAENTPHYRRVDSKTEYMPEYHAPQKRMFRLRFETADQVFETDAQRILPLEELACHPEWIKKSVWGEIPALIYPAREQYITDLLQELKRKGLSDVVCENIGAVPIARDLGFSIHGGAYLNVLNSQALAEYQTLGLTDCVLSFELSFALQRRMKSAMPRGFIGYGYLPLMKFRSCPNRGEKGCGDCEGISCMTDRTGADFILLCRQRQYSELLNCVPIYVGDKSLPSADFELLYFTKETKAEAKSVFESYISGTAVNFERTGGLYYRELL